MTDLLNIPNKLQELDKKREELYVKNKKHLPYYFVPSIVALLLSIPLILKHPAFLAITGVVSIIALIIYSVNFLNPFASLKRQLKTALLEQYMSTFHPSVRYEYYNGKRSVREIMRRTRLESADDYDEEDVIQGKLGEGSFYLSEVHLQDEDSEDNSKTTVFKGLLFEVSIPNRSFPESKIVANPGLFGTWFSGLEKSEKYDLYYETKDKLRFLKELEPLLPFIKHLSKDGNVKVKTEGNRITMMLESDMRFLDDPSPKMSESFINQEQYKSIGKQMNTVLFILESLMNNSSTAEIEERLELKTLEMVELEGSDERELNSEM